MACPMRVWLLVISGIVAAYLAWTSSLFSGAALDEEVDHKQVIIEGCDLHHCVALVCLALDVHAHLVHQVGDYVQDASDGCGVQSGVVEVSWLASHLRSPTK